MKKFLYTIVILIIFPLNCYSLNTFDEGKALFEKNSVEEAVTLFEEALVTQPSKDVFKYLAESYNILGQFEDEILVLEEALSTEIGDPSYFNFKLGNAFYLVGDYKYALESYLKVLDLNKDYVSETFLNIANVSVELGLYSSAIDNYSKYLELEPSSSQKRNIIKMIFMLKKAHKEQLALSEEQNKLDEELRQAKADEAQRLEEARLEKTGANETLAADREQRARELDEERLMYAMEEEALREDKKEFEIAEEKVLNPPDPDIEEQRRQLQLREQELLSREQKVLESENALKEAEIALEQSNLESKVQEPRIKTEEELAEEQRARELEEFTKKKIEEEKRQQLLMNDILQSLEKIGENAKGINATSEDAFGELEGSGIDE